MVAMAFFDRFRNVLVVLDLDPEVEQTLRVTEWLAPAVEQVHCLYLPNARAELEELETERTNGARELDTFCAGWRERNPALQLTRAFEGALDAARVARVA
jgi:hypothetical protein